MGGLSGVGLLAFVGAFCDDHGVPVKLTSLAVTSRVAVLLRGGVAKARRETSRPTGCRIPRLFPQHLSDCRRRACVAGGRGHRRWRWNK